MMQTRDDLLDDILKLFPQRLKSLTLNSIEAPKCLKAMKEFSSQICTTKKVLGKEGDKHDIKNRNELNNLQGKECLNCKTMIIFLLC